jgi:Rps23 Pro-64 3,4-dihydroxylase Tpa1-like proline 4-hydroxylase
MSQDGRAMGPATQELLLMGLCSPEFAWRLTEMTGIRDLVPDLHGGGMHLTPPGGKLGIHTDFNMGLNGHRRLNVLLFLNSRWNTAWGGDLELWRRDRTFSVRIAPVANRLVVFSTSERSFHGHPDPLACPPDRARKSLAVYFFTKEAPVDAVPPHSTVFL